MMNEVYYPDFILQSFVKNIKAQCKMQSKSMTNFGSDFILILHEVVA